MESTRVGKMAYRKLELFFEYLPAQSAFLDQLCIATRGKMCVGKGMAAHAVPPPNPVTHMVPRHGRQRMLRTIGHTLVKIINNKIVESLDAEFFQNGQGILVCCQVGIIKSHRHRWPREPFSLAQSQTVIEVSKPKTHLAKGGKLRAESISETIRNGVVAQNPPVRLGPSSRKTDSTCVMHTQTLWGALVYRFAVK